MEGWTIQQAFTTLKDEVENMKGIQNKPGRWRAGDGVTGAMGVPSEEASAGETPGPARTLARLEHEVKKLNIAMDEIRRRSAESLVMGSTTASAAATSKCHCLHVDGMLAVSEEMRRSIGEAKPDIRKLKAGGPGGAGGSDKNSQFPGHDNGSVCHCSHVDSNSVEIEILRAAGNETSILLESLQIQMNEVRDMGPINNDGQTRGEHCHCAHVDGLLDTAAVLDVRVTELERVAEDQASRGNATGGASGAPNNGRAPLIVNGSYSGGPSATFNNTSSGQDATPQQQSWRQQNMAGFATAEECHAAAFQAQQQQQQQQQWQQHQNHQPQAPPQPQQPNMGGYGGLGTPNWSPHLSFGGQAQGPQYTLPLRMGPLGQIDASNIFDEKMTERAEFKYNGPTGGDEWKRRLEGYLIPRVPALKELFEYIELLTASL